MDDFYFGEPQRQQVSAPMDIATELMQVHYWQRIDRMLDAAIRAGRDLAVSSPRHERGQDGVWRLVWEHQFLEPGEHPVTRPGKKWHVYRCS